MGRILLFALMFSILAGVPCDAQRVDVVINGVVRDRTGAGLARATVTIRNVDTGLLRSFVTDPSGVYRSAPVPPGRFEVTAELSGFRTQVRTGQVHVGAVLTIDFTLDIGASGETVHVISGVPILETGKNSIARLITREELDALPVIDRNFNALASLAPGVTPTGTYGGVEINGSRDFQNGYNLDGLSGEGLGAGEQRLAFAQDWIQEFQVLTSQFDAEFGRASGGIINVLTRSGANRTSGRAYGFFRNEAWDAQPAFSATKARLDSKRLGATAGGKVVADRLFYFTGFEWFDDASSRAVNSSFAELNGSVPATADQKAFLFKLQHQLGGAGNYAIRYNGDWRESTNDGVGGRATEEFGRSLDYVASDLLAVWTQTVSSSAFNELRGALTGTASGSACNYAQTHAPGSWFARQYPGAFLGCPSTGFGDRDTRELQLIENFSWTRGSHDFKVGGDASRATSSGNYRFARDGVYEFDRDIRFDLSNPASYPFRFAWFQGRTEWDYSRWSWGVFAQDTWRARPDLTLNLGVRYDIDGSLTAVNPLIRVDKGLQTVRPDRDNVAPRAGVAWTPFDNGGRTIIRGGIGAYYDEHHQNIASLLLNLSALVDRSLMLNALSPLLNPFWPDQARARRILAEALAGNTVPDASVLPGIVGGSPAVASDFEVPWTVQSSVGLTHDFGGGFTASASAVFARGLDQYVIGDVNIDLQASQQQGRTVRINPNYSFINQYSNQGRFNYRSVQVQSSYMPSPRHFVKLSYTWATNKSNTQTALEGVGAGGVAGGTNPFDYDEDYGPAHHDVRHNLAVNGVTTLPFRLQLSGIVSARSALPWSVVPVSTQLDADPFFDRPEPRNSRRGDNFFSLDLRALQSIPIGAKRSLTAFVEVFNVTNATNYTSYVGTPGALQFGQPTAALERRRTQLGLRFDF